tara:strand:- start:2369 stop:3289 length:921 start_codon:yes stop_codon:yes gene_type:complete
MNIDYKQKYSKYKNKYLKMKALYKNKIKGGTQFKISDSQKLKLEHIDGGPNQINYGCGLGVLNYLGAPIDDIIIMCQFVDTEHGGIPFVTMKNYIQLLQNSKFQNEQFKNSEGQPHNYNLEMCYWNVDTDGEIFIHEEEDWNPAFNPPMEFPDTYMIIETIVRDIIKVGNSMILGIWTENNVGHYTVLSNDNETPCIIETQAVGKQGIYRGREKIAEYFDMRITYLITYTTVPPRIFLENNVKNYNVDHEIDLSNIDNSKSVNNLKREELSTYLMDIEPEDMPQVQPEVMPQVQPPEYGLGFDPDL